MANINDKISCLLEKHDLENKRMELLNDLTIINTINIENSNDLLMSDNSELINLNKWINKTDCISHELIIKNIDSGIAMCEIAKESYIQSKFIINELREILLSIKNNDNNEIDIDNMKNIAISFIMAIEASFINASYNSYENIFNIDISINSCKEDLTKETIILEFSVPSISILLNLVNNLENISIDTIDNFDLELDTIIFNHNNLTNTLLNRRSRLINSIKNTYIEFEDKRYKILNVLNNQISNCIKSLSYLNVCL